MTSYNPKPLTIVPGADTRAMREKKLLQLQQEAVEIGGYCGQCKVHYPENYTKHKCK